MALKSFKPENDTKHAPYVLAITSLSCLIVLPRTERKSTVLPIQQPEQLEEASPRQPVNMMKTRPASAQPSILPVDSPRAMTEALAGLIIQTPTVIQPESKMDPPSATCLYKKDIMDRVNAQPPEPDSNPPLDRYIAERPVEQCWFFQDKDSEYISTIKDCAFEAVDLEPVVDNGKEGPVHIDSMDVAMAHSLDIPEDLSFVGIWCPQHEDE